MASTTISAVTTLITGVEALSSNSTLGTADTIYVYGPSGGDLDFNTLTLRIANASGATAVLNLTASTDFSDGDLGDASISIPASKTVYVGGADFEASRFKHVGTSGTVYAVITCPDTASVGCVITATQAPYSVTG